MTKPSDLILYSLAQKPIEFGDTFNTLIKDRLEVAINNKKLELSKTLFDEPVENEEDSEDQTEYEVSDENEESEENEEQQETELEVEDNEDA